MHFHMTMYTPTEGGDYTEVRETLLLESGFTAGACVPLIVGIIKDGVLESDETFQLSATDTSRHAIASSNNGGTALITIDDDDSACEYNKLF